MICVLYLHRHSNRYEIMNHSKTRENNPITDKLIDYLLINSSSITQSGLYRGKAGIALTLFELSRHKHNGYLEEQACELMQESLLSNTSDIGFENGSAGIGYVLSYLIENKFIDADFNELFDDKTAAITAELRRRDRSLSTITDMKRHAKILYFLRTLLRTEKCGEDMKVLAGEMTAEVEGYLNKMLSDNAIGTDAAFVTEAMNTYLSLCDADPSFEPDETVADNYVRAYNRNKTASDFITGYYLERIATKTENSALSAVATDNMVNAVNGLYPPALSMRRRTDMLHLMYRDKTRFGTAIKSLESGLIDTQDEMMAEKNLYAAVRGADHMVGYGSGIARLLLCQVCRDSNGESRIALL